MDMTIVFVFCFIVVVFAIMMGTIKEVAKRQMAFKERKLELEHAGGTGGLVAEAAARLDNMEQRLRVLECIATDSGSNVSADLAREIEALRYEQHVADSGVPIDLKEPIDVKEKVR
ncbi:hypothetical protein M3P36_14295 [Altererythrobacter sp. KTW20L]|uniref:hypothetical protein n=1 Tax=Altererythrobacter sp. KTW20L TaxID=2942210 RepID=UPI0020BE836F|nr:hypothetical protein [Altererythrobacter sp. KTW20L]MCL6252211.1 hypothetical protein [Altererythrobacter sp. KTW20L]